MKLGSLCTGVGGLDLAVEQHFGAELAWCAEIDPAASRVLAARFSGVENIGNFVGQSPEPVDVLCGGFPCQPVSLAGKRAGTDDIRWLFDDICDLVGRMAPRPRVLVFENVRGLLSANDGDAMGRVVHGLARLGYVGSWRIVRASDVGAPHRRERVFIVAHADESGPQGTQPAQRHDVSARRGGDVANAVRFGQHQDSSSSSSTDSARQPGRPADGGRVASDAGGTRAGWDSGAVPRTVEGARRPEHDVSAVVDGGAALADADMRRRIERDSRIGQLPLVDSVGAGADFGPYAEAVERWERVLGRTAPAPVDERRRLSPDFVQWLMGFPAGWVTDILDRRTDALRCLGNAVVPQQAMHALALLDVRVLTPA